jgi:hypothetical protein
MKEQSQKNVSTINVNDILEVLGQHNFSNQKQVTTDVLMLLLQKSGISATFDDKAKMARSTSIIPSNFSSFSSK